MNLYRLKAKCITFFCCLLLVQTSLFAQENIKITIIKNDISLREALLEVERQSTMSVAYNESQLNTTKRISLNIKSQTIGHALDFILKGTGFSYKMSNGYIMIFADKKENVVPKKIKGKVVDVNGEPLIGVNVKIKNDPSGTITDLDGNFTLQANKGDILDFSYVGYTAQSVKITLDASLSVVMKEDTKILSEVVVTALGIKKEAKSLSYNVQQLNASDIVGVKDANFMNSLAGKVAGVAINTSSSGIGGGTKVVMRGAKSITGNNNALYVIDGIPMPSLETTQPSDLFTGMGQSGDGASMINPEDIERMSVLSGAAASALYGSEAANGVIMITTKKGNTERLNVTYSNNTSFFDPFVMPEFQNSYGSETGSYYSWGNKLSTPSGYKPKDFFQTGWNENNAITISNGTEKNQTFFSMASTNAEGIVNNNTLNRYNFSIRNTTSMLNDKLHLDLNANYMNVREQNMVAQGQYFNPIVATYLFPVSEDMNKYKVFEQYQDPERNFKTQYWPYGNLAIGMQNPYWITQRDLFVNHKNRFLMSAGLSYKIAKGITLGARAKMDYTAGISENKYSASTDAVFAGEMGAYHKSDYSMRQTYGDVMLNVDKYFGDFSLMATLGTSIQDLVYGYYSIGGDLNSVASGFTLRNLNTTKSKPYQDNYHDQTQSVFATAQLGWKSKLYLDVTGRVDWSSALAWTDYTSIAYPSVGLSAILTDLLPIKNDVLSFLKLRGSYSEVGNAPTRYIAHPGYPYESGTPTTQSTYPNTDIRPERTKAWEAGLESHLWGNKLALNVSLYKTSTYNQLFNPSLSATSGYKSMYINAGRVDNKGLEASLTLNQPLRNVKWTSSLVYTINRNKIKKLLPPTQLKTGEIVELDRLNMGGIGNVNSILTEGGSIGDLYVTCLQTDEHGFINVDYTSKGVFVAKNAGDKKDGYIYAGNSQAKYTIGWRNSFTWKGLSLGFLINARVGGIGVSMTQALMDAYGVSKATADARDAGGALVNGYRIPAQAYYQTVGTGAGSMYVYSATNVRLAELTLGYDVPITHWASFIKGMNVAFTGRNLFMFYNKAPYDPELTASTGTHFSGMDYFMMPSLRNLGFSVKLNF